MIKGNIKLLVPVALVAPIIALATAASAGAAEKEHHPTGVYAKFNQCPTENPNASACNIAESHGGEFQIGSAATPIVKPIILQEGLRFNEETQQDEVTPATDGETLVKAAEVVPGGIFALVKEGRYPWYLRNFCKNFPNNSECKVTATAELVGLPFISIGNIAEQQGTALEIPLRFHLKNPFLGGKCYIGSASDPITPVFTTGTKPALGTEPEMKGLFGTSLEFIQGEFESIIAVLGDELVDNAFVAPKAEGCGGPQSVLVDKEIDEKQALPAPAGHNRARLISTLYLVSAEAVKKSEA